MINVSFVISSLGELLIMLSLPGLISYALFRIFKSSRLFKFSLIINYSILLILLLNFFLIPLNLSELIKLI